MKKSSILILLILYFSFHSNGQSRSIAFYDAKFIKDSCLNSLNKFKGIDNLTKILSNYYPNIKTDDSIIKTILVNNPFLKPFLPTGGISQSLIKGSYSGFQASSIANLNVTSIADGLARFLIKRGKEELNVAFFNQFKEFLKKHEECRVLFPNTVDLLEKIDSYKYATFLENLRSNFHTDLGNLIIHLNQVIDLPDYKTFFDNHSEIKLVINTANIVSELSQAGNNVMPDSIISQLAKLPWGSVGKNSRGIKNLENSLKLLNLLSQSIRADTTQNQSIGADSLQARSWVQLSELNKNLFADSITLRIYFGLIYQEASIQNIAFHSTVTKDSIRLDTLLGRQAKHIFRLSGLIQNFSLLANEVQNSIEDIKTKKAAGGLSVDDYYTYINKAINIIDYGFKLPVTFDISKKLQKEILEDKYISVARNANYLYKNIYSKDYSNAVMNVCSILDSLIMDTQKKKIISGILKYGTFMASVVKAESPEEVEAAIEAAALPAGSSSIKKNSAINVSLNAYIGGYFARQTDHAKDFDGNNSKVGVTAPVGIAFSMGLGHFKNGSSLGALSLYGTLIDVGAIAGFRLNNDSTALEQKVTLNDIFTPGGYLVYGIGLPFLSYVPLSIGYGWQYGSKLYNKENGKISISESSRWRSNWFVAIDIPLANFWTKNYRKGK